MHHRAPLLLAALAALLTTVSCSEEGLSLPCPKGPQELHALWSSPSLYDKFTRPPHGPRDASVKVTAGYSPPTSVNVTLVPLKLGEFNTITQMMTIDVEMTMSWFDSRTAFNASCASELAPPYAFGTQLQGSWMPAIFDSPHDAGLWFPRFAIDNLFPGSRPGFYPRGHMLQIASTGFVWYSFRASVDVKCPMHFARMPLDEQTCSLRMMALEGVDRVNISTDRVNISFKEKLDEMSSAEWECQSLTQEAGVYHDSSGRFQNKSFTDLKIVLKRENRYWVQTVIVPTILLLAISWASFFISRAAVPARVAMCALPSHTTRTAHDTYTPPFLTPRSLICYLTLTNLAGQVNASIPKVSYPVKLIDSIQFSRWCVFFSIIEYALANWLMRIEGRIEKAAAKVAKRKVDQEEAAKAAAVLSGTTAVVPGAGLGEVQTIVNGNARNSGTSATSATISESAADRATCSWSCCLDDDLVASSVPKKRDVKAIKKRLSVIDRRFINTNGHMGFRDQHLDVYSRFAYPVVCIVGLTVVIWS